MKFYLLDHLFIKQVSVTKCEKMADLTLNALGKKCPMPILLTKKELKKMSPGQTLELIVDDKGIFFYSVVSSIINFIAINQNLG